MQLLVNTTRFGLQVFISDNASFYAGKTGLVMGSAPSVSVAKNLDSNVVKIGVGDLPFRAENLGPFDFWVSSNGYYPLAHDEKHLSHIRKYCKKFLLSPQSLQEVDKKNCIKTLDFISSILPSSNIIIYDQTHFGGETCFPKNYCCDFWDYFGNESSLQDLLSAQYQIEDSYKITHTVATHGFALAVLLKLNPIYIAGIELPVTVKDYNYYHWWKNPLPLMRLRLLVQRARKPRLKTDFGGNALTDTLKDFENIARIAREANISVYCLNKNSILTKVDGIDYLSVTNNA